MAHGQEKKEKVELNDMGELGNGTTQMESGLSWFLKFVSWAVEGMILGEKKICFTLKVRSVAEEPVSSNGHVIGEKQQRVLQTLGCKEALNDSRHAVKDQCFCVGSNALGWIHLAKLIISVQEYDGIDLSDVDGARLFEMLGLASGTLKNVGVSLVSLYFGGGSDGHIGLKLKEGEGNTFYLAIPLFAKARNHQKYTLLHELPSNKNAQKVSQSGLDSYSGTDRSPPSKVSEGENKSHPPVFTQKGCGRRVLLVEDTIINRIMLRKILQNLNLHCEEAENGQVAVDFLKQGRTYDLILMDKEMPVMDGHEATRQLRNMGVKTPIVALTGNSLQSDKELFIAAGVDDFQNKPLSREKLMQLLTRFGV